MMIRYVLNSYYTITISYDWANRWDRTATDSDGTAIYSVFVIFYMLFLLYYNDD